jgi:hypothetical protein
MLQATAEVEAALDRKHEIERAEAYLKILQEIGPLLARLTASRRKGVPIRTRLDTIGSKTFVMNHWFIRNAPTVTVRTPLWHRLFGSKESDLSLNFWLREDGVIVFNLRLPKAFKKRQRTVRYNLLRLDQFSMSWMAKVIQDQDLNP